MRRWIGHVPLGLSVVVLLGLAVFWPISHRVAYGLGLRGTYWGERGHVTQSYRAFLDSGRVVVVVTYWHMPELTPDWVRHLRASSQEQVRQWQQASPNGWVWEGHALRSGTLLEPQRDRLGFAWYKGVPGDVNQHVSIPFWFLALLAGLLPARRLNQYRRQRSRGRRGLCLVCGYDLRASPERCPECGTPSPLEAGPQAGMA